MALFDQSNQVPGVPPNLPISNSPVPPPPPPPISQGYVGQAPPPAPRATSPVPFMPPPTPSRVPEPEDIFSGTSHGANIPRMPETTASIAESPAKGLGRKLIRLLFLALGAAVVVTAGYFGWNYIMGVPKPEVTITPTNINVSELNANENVNVPQVILNENVPLNIPFLNGNNNANANVPAVDMATDTDLDGLVDFEEINIYHTDPLKADTDGDGLNDREEVMIWHTDPLKPDTDSDGYPDGVEVKNGYNPLGPGKLPPSP